MKHVSTSEEHRSTKPPINSLAQIFSVFLRIGLLSFGGPAAQISLMHRELVEQRQWLSEKQFLDALSFCMLLPGPEAMQLATYAGWRLQGVKGGLIAGLLFVIPGSVVIFTLASIYAIYGDVPLLKTLFLGVKAAVLVIVIEALLRVSKRALTERTHWFIAAFAFVGIFFFSLPYPLIILLAGIYGAIASAQKVDDRGPASDAVSASGTARTIFVGLIIWCLPVVVLSTIMGPSVLIEISVFFAKLAVLTFGGAYAVLAYMAQDVVSLHGWLSAGEMLDGLGLAETTPGPLILVTQFVGFLAAFREGGFALGLAGGLLTLWVTFVPCFIWIFAGAPYIDWIAARPRLKSGLQAITAAVVGVILHLSLWFGLHVLFEQVDLRVVGLLTLWQPTLSSLHWEVVVIAIVSAFILLRLKLSLPIVLTVASCLALILM